MKRANNIRAASDWVDGDGLQLSNIICVTELCLFYFSFRILDVSVSD